MEIASKEMLIQVTGYIHKNKQIKWLKDRFKPFEINRFGDPIITVEVLFNLPITQAEKKSVKPKWQPKET